MSIELLFVHMLSHDVLGSPCKDGPLCRGVSARTVTWLQHLVAAVASLFFPGELTMSHPRRSLPSAWPSLAPPVCYWSPLASEEGAGTKGTGWLLQSWWDEHTGGSPSRQLEGPREGRHVCCRKTVNLPTEKSRISSEAVRCVGKKSIARQQDQLVGSEFHLYY